MTENEIFHELFNGGRFSLPFLIKFSCPGLTSIYLVNNNENVILDNNTYLASSFTYTEPDTNGKGASLSISGVDNNLIEFVEKASQEMRLDVTGVIAKSGEVQRIKSYAHLYGNVSYSSDMKLEFQLGHDDRLEMSFPPYKFDTDTNRGNT